jgi:putative membrane protein insertion efficiency factor
VSSRPGRWLGPELRRALRLVPRVPVLLLVLVLRAYQLLVSPMLGPTCRFYPSCSAYAVDALRTHGLFRGVWLTVRRLLRCHPWNPGGVDLVPPRAGRHPHRAPTLTQVHVHQDHSRDSVPPSSATAA